MSTLARFHEQTVRKICESSQTITDAEVQSRARLTVGEIIDIRFIREVRIKMAREKPPVQRWPKAAAKPKGDRLGAIREIHGVRVEAAATAD